MKKELRFVKSKSYKKFNLIHEGSNKKMEDAFFYLPNIEVCELFNEAIEGNTELLKNRDYATLYNFTKNNTICNKTRCETCRIYCYCNKLRFQQYNLSSRINVLLHYLNNSVEFFNRIEKEIRLNGNEVLRIHTEGEFFSEEYLQQWVALAKRNKKVKFYSYTKNFELFSNIKLPSNFYLQLSYDMTCNYPLPVELLKIGKVNVYLTYKTQQDVDAFMEKYGEYFTSNDLLTCKGKCRKCKQCYKGKGNKIHLCKVH